MKQFGSRLEIARGKMSRKAVSIKMGIHANTYGNFERGDRWPDAGFVINFCKMFNINPTWLLTGQGPMHMPDNSTGLETELLEKIIAKVEEHLNDAKMILSTGKKAEIISILYEEALEKEEWREQLGIDKKTKRFIKLLSNENGGLSTDQPFHERVSDLAREAYYADIDNAVVNTIKKVAQSECVTEEEIRNEMIRELQSDIAEKQKQKDKLDAQFIVLVAGYLISAILAVIIMRALPGLASMLLSCVFVLLGLLCFYHSDIKLRPRIAIIKRNISASNELLLDLLKRKINKEIKELASTKAEDTLRGSQNFINNRRTED